MSARQQWRWFAIAVWFAVACIIFISIDSMAARSWLFLLVAGVLPPTMLPWLVQPRTPPASGGAPTLGAALNGTFRTAPDSSVPVSRT